MLGPPKLFLEKKKFLSRCTVNKCLPSRTTGSADMDDDTAGIEYQVNDIIDLERRIA
ncbi:hypothetical protein OSTOST_24594, partial [Ostertagia ostertagi]